jgi:hypothetical protein
MNEVTTIAGKYKAGSSGKLAEAQDMAGKISDYVKKQATLGNHVSYAEAASRVEATGTHATAEKISAYVAEQRKLGNRMSYAEAAAHVETVGGKE